MAFGCGVLLLGFFCSMMFVATARTIVFYLPVADCFAARYLSRRLQCGFSPPAWRSEHGLVCISYVRTRVSTRCEITG